MRITILALLAATLSLAPVSGSVAADTAARIASPPTLVEARGDGPAVSHPTIRKRRRHESPRPREGAGSDSLIVSWKASGLLSVSCTMSIDGTQHLVIGSPLFPDLFEALVPPLSRGIHHGEIVALEVGLPPRVTTTEFTFRTRDAAPPILLSPPREETPGPEPPAESVLGSACPNPFATSTSMAITLTREQAVSLTVHDVAGRLVRTVADRRFGPGEHELRWDGRADSGEKAAPGVYFVRLVSESAADVKRVTRLR